MKKGLFQTTLSLDPAMPEAYDTPSQLDVAFRLFCNRVLTDTNLVRAGNKSARTGPLILNHYYKYKGV